MGGADGGTDDDARALVLPLLLRAAPLSGLAILARSVAAAVSAGETEGEAPSSRLSFNFSLKPFRLVRNSRGDSSPCAAALSAASALAGVPPPHVARRGFGFCFAGELGLGARLKPMGMLKRKSACGIRSPRSHTHQPERAISQQLCGAHGRAAAAAAAMRSPIQRALSRVGCSWRDLPDQPPRGRLIKAAPPGFINYRNALARAGAPLSFRVCRTGEHACGTMKTNLKLLVRMGCIGAAASSGRLAEGGVVTSSNPSMCGNKSQWWGFAGRRNVDGMLREMAGPGLAEECDAKREVQGAKAGEKLLVGDVRATGGHALTVRYVLHALPPSSYYSARSEGALRRTYARCLDLAHQRDLTCLALPALGCGIAGFPAAVSACAAFDAVEEYAKRLSAAATWRDCGEASDHGEAHAHARGRSGSSTMSVEFVLIDEGVYAAFADAAHMRWGRGATTYRS